MISERSESRVRAASSARLDASPRTGEDLPTCKVVYGRRRAASSSHQSANVSSVHHEDLI
ncbi:hypothetical protein PGT21_008842 [Puccinia graminis f. sp. tritici]|uniref:Uncharacterized protein n=1 Tax=Puccinia graminis f. sp. tritici TaxID=56615 RepID=A0A5B0RTB0_PUCGR|nr:hypothetical protein PGT21_008842 [Puccinia graminis f. sp. tritici]KAA1128817.1 hypothetical protein PGTUg99_023588 [Puccinia graminis f. sp. tritici]